MKISFPKLRELKLLDFNYTYNFEEDASDTSIVAKDKQGNLWKFERYEVRKYYTGQ